MREYIRHGGGFIFSTRFPDWNDRRQDCEQPRIRTTSRVVTDDSELGGEEAW